MDTTSKQQLIKYHNDLNKIKLPAFTEQEQNLLMGIISKVKDKPENSIINFTAQELLEFSTKNYTNKELESTLLILRDKFFKADFTVLIEKDDMIGKETINLFQKFTLWYSKEKELKPQNLLKVEMQVNPYFAYLVNNITDHFTKFSFLEFKEVDGKYTKTLYRLLKQYKTTGILRMNWEEFTNVMDVPENYTISDIDKRILKPAVKQLGEPKNLFNRDWILFNNLAYIKIKGKGRGRGGSVIGIEFTFDKKIHEDDMSDDDKVIEVELSDDEEKKENKPSTLKNKIMGLNKPTNLIGINDPLEIHIGKYLSLFDEKTQKFNKLKIVDVGCENGKIKLSIMNIDDGHINHLQFENEKHLDNYVKKYKQ